MSEVAQQERIELLSYAELEEVQGSVGNFHVRIRKKARGVSDEDCTGCGLCEEKCPRQVLDQAFEVGLGHRKAIYMPFPQAVPRTPVIDRDNCIWFQRGKCGACKKLCPTGAVDFDQQDELVELDVGNIILATGYDAFDPSKMPQYGHGRLANVFTSLEFERMCNASGPTGGRIVLRDGKTEPTSIAVIHCVGSRDHNHNPYCSNVCCMSALKFGHLAMEKTGARVTSFYIDMRTTFKDYDEFYQRLLDEGMTFVRGKVAEVTDAARFADEEGKLIVQAEDTLLGQQRRIPVDMVVLMTALEPQTDAREMGLKCGIPCSASGWFSERHPKLDPVATMTDGVFVAGACQGPKDIPASVAQGAAAAARVQGMIARGEVLIEPIVATIHEDSCSGCRICNGLCPFNAIEFVADREVSRVTHELCKGCGTCVAACPAQAIRGAHFSNDQILAEIEGLLRDVSDRPPGGEPTEEAA
jgi:heterodisulfide reductase subunit A